ncbi:uncharacterized protein CIMG_00148 [Coccidioides immitis RS]|uniref:Uncharacterized protein n=1 Tax=Coccidioides immitis (strain RS) TaxID=246410 RepID=A0A0E1RZ55_COCIM|nr:uncharacterized protein CIMG_00148 [Coccidioides immitis RS]EAS34794.2 hypothetical protein CIMG_00148 [Coccidioides immitis RS]
MACKAEQIQSPLIEYSILTYFGFLSVAVNRRERLQTVLGKIETWNYGNALFVMQGSQGYRMLFSIQTPRNIEIVAHTAEIHRPVHTHNSGSCMIDSATKFGGVQESNVNPPIRTVTQIQLLLHRPGICMGGGHGRCQPLACESKLNALRPSRGQGTDRTSLLLGEMRGWPCILPYEQKHGDVVVDTTPQRWDDQNGSDESI